MLHNGLVMPKLNLRGLITIVMSFFSLLLISLHIEPFASPPGQPLSAVADHRGLGVLPVCKVITSKVFVKTIG
jgi:hypothetical protein